MVKEVPEGGSEVLFEYFLKFVEELRSSGMPVSTGDLIDAMSALGGTSLSDVRSLRACLQTTLVTSASHEAVFSMVFDTYFAALRNNPTHLGGEPGTAGRPLHALDDEALSRLLHDSLAQGDRAVLKIIAEEAVLRYSRMKAGRASGVNYYASRALLPLDIDAVLEDLDNEARACGGSKFEMVLRSEERADSAAFLTQEVKAAVKRRLIEDRGPEAVGRTLRTPLPEDVDFLRASTEQLAAMEHAIAPLGRRLARTLVRGQTARRSHRVDFPATNRASMAYGGVPGTLRFRRKAPHRPELVVIADVSGSVSSFAAFTLQLIFSLRSTFGRVRTFAFVDGVDEVSQYLATSRDLAQTIHHMNTDAEIVWFDGHSDYGNALSVFWERWGTTLGRRTSVLILGDARSNYHAPQSAVLNRIRRRAGAIYWLNPEPKDRWNSGDSIISEYAAACDAVVECRNLRQLEAFVARLG